MNEPPLQIVSVISLHCLSDRKCCLPARRLQPLRLSLITGPVSSLYPATGDSDLPLCPAISCSTEPGTPWLIHIDIYFYRNIFWNLSSELIAPTRRLFRCHLIFYCLCEAAISPHYLCLWFSLWITSQTSAAVTSCACGHLQRSTGDIV